MLNKKQKLQMLKQAVIHMKNQLTQITENNTQKKLANNKSKNKELGHVQTERKLSNKKQSFPLMNNTPKKEIPINKRFQSRQGKETHTKYLSKIKNIMEAVDNQYYKKKSTINYGQSERKSISRTKIPQMQSLVTLTSQTDRKYYQSVYTEVSEKENEQCQRENNCFSKNNLLVQQRNRIKIFSLPFNDPILNPRQEKPLGKKIVKKVEKYPSSFLVNNPQCNENLKFYGNVGIVSQSKGKLSGDHNRSLIFQNIGPVRQGRSCSKRHFGRYFQEQYSSCI